MELRVRCPYLKTVRLLVPTSLHLRVHMVVCLQDLEGILCLFVNKDKRLNPSGLTCVKWVETPGNGTDVTPHNESSSRRDEEHRILYLRQRDPVESFVFRLSEMKSNVPYSRNTDSNTILVRSIPVYDRDDEGSID